MIEHDEGCRGCAVAQRISKHGVTAVTADLAECDRCGPTYRSGSYLHAVEGKRYCAGCADIMARARNERAYVAAMYGVGLQ